MNLPPKTVLSKTREVLNDEAQSPGDWNEITVELAQALLAAQQREKRLREWIYGVRRAAEISPISQSALVEGATKALAP